MFKAKPHVAPALAPAKAINRKTSFILIGVGVVATAVTLIPGFGGFIGGGISHIVDRLTNHAKSHDEIKLRANYYRNIVGAKLGKDPSKVTVNDFMLVAKSDPTFGQVLQDIKHTEDRSNRESLMLNGSVAAAGLVGLAPVAEGAKLSVHALKWGKEGVKVIAPMIAGTAASSLFNKDHVSAQEVVERIHECILDAEQRGVSTKGAVTPQLVFLLRVAQDEHFAAEIKQKYGKPYQKLSEEQQLQVMQDYPALANAVTSEAYAVSDGMMQAQELAATQPNLNSRSASYKMGASNTSFVDTLARQRANAAGTSVAPTA
jgi:hypothetical protein